jgi:hypothetical protein
MESPNSTSPCAVSTVASFEKLKPASYSIPKAEDSRAPVKLKSMPNSAKTARRGANNAIVTMRRRSQPCERKNCCNGIMTASRIIWSVRKTTTALSVCMCIFFVLQGMDIR